MTAEDDRVQAALAASLPVPVDGYSSEYLDLGWINLWGTTEGGATWHLSVTCASRFDSPDYSWDSTDDESSKDVVERLQGAQLIRVEVGDDLVNPVLRFSGDQTLRVIADTDVDPWVLSLPGMPWVLVGVHQDHPLEDADWM